MTKLGSLSSLALLAALLTSCGNAPRQEASALAGSRWREPTAATLTLGQGGIWFNGDGRQVTVEAGRTDMPYVYDYPYAPPFIASLGAGETLTVYYARSAGELGRSGVVKGVRVFDSVDGGPAQSRDATRDGSAWFQAQVTVPVTAVDRLEVWFEVELEDGSKVWDSAFGKNYHVNVIPAGCTALTFEAPRNDRWKEPQPDAPIRAGKGLCVTYELDRIKALGVGVGSYRGSIVEPSVEGWAQFTDEHGGVVARYAFNRASDRTLLEVPEGARQVRLWFKGWNYYAGVPEHWDNDFGADFRFPVAND